MLRLDRVPLSANHSDIELLCKRVETLKPEWMCRLMLDRTSPHATWLVSCRIFRGVFSNQATGVYRLVQKKLLWKLRN